jgi:hypothetical protein
VLQTAASGEARFDHDPVTGESKGLLIEEARTNLFPYDNPSASDWFKNESTVTANALTAPDGTTTASKLVENTATAVHYTSETITVSGDTRYTMSVFAKAGERGFLKLQCGFVSNWVLAHDIIFDLSDGSLHNSTHAQSVEGTDFGSYNMGNGWYRLWISGTTISSATAAGFNLHLATGVGNEVNYTGNGYSGVFVWGAQFEEGSFPTSYIPTSGSTVTRAKDDASITGDNFSSFFSNQVGTIYCEYGQIHEGDPKIGERLVTVFPDNNTVKYNLEGYRAEVRHATSWDGINFNNETRNGGKVAIAFDDTGFSAASLGVLQGNVTRQPDTYQSTKMYIGSSVGGSHTNACIPKVAYYPKRLTSAQLVAMTEA